VTDLPRRDSSVWRVTVAGLCATLVGIGLARFAYTPLLPALVSGGWFPSSQAAYLGAANLAGYLGGALCARPLARRIAARAILRAMMLLVGVAFFACALPLSFTWFFLWRFASGLAGGTVMVLAAPTVLPHVPAARRGLVGGAIFTGVGLGIAASGTVVPLLLEAGLAQAWCGLGVLSLLLTALAWGGWPADSAPAAASGSATSRPALRGLALRGLYVEYARNAAGLVPHMVFLVDFVARGLGRGIGSGARYWVVFGVGAVLGPMLTGAAADRIGFGPALRAAFAVQAAAVLLPTVATDALALGVSSLVVGAAVPGIVPLVLGRVLDLIPGDPEGQRAAWSVTTMAFALGQAVGAYGFSFLFARGDDYLPLFSLAAACIVLALTVDLAARLAAPRPI
jgi:predicted MFS family arabinose efflux permease